MCEYSIIENQVDSIEFNPEIIRNRQAILNTMVTYNTNNYW